MAESRLLPFLDTSVVRALLMGTHPYRDFLSQELGDRLYVCRFVDMEFKRGVLLTLIDFLNILAMPHIPTIEDAEKVWSNKFQIRQVKLLLSLSASIFGHYKLSRTDPKDKERGIMCLAVAIKSYDRAMRNRFKNLSDRTHCPCGETPVHTSVSPERVKQELNAYADRFRDAASSPQACRMKEFFEYFTQDLSACIHHVESLPDSEKHKNVKQMASETKKIQEDRTACSCRACMKMGDVVISVGAERKMRLETLDRAFPYWCQPIKQPHRVHRSETDYLNSLGKSG